jgi:hypothetical protein
MNAPPKSETKKRRFLASESIASIEKVLSKKVDGGIYEDAAAGRPSHVMLDGPNLAHTGSNLHGESPAPDDGAGDGGTHDVNYEMLAKQYRRGLRIRGNRTLWSKSLDFLFGDH